MPHAIAASKEEYTEPYNASGSYMNASISKTKQLSEYRSWPDGRNGALFYVPMDYSKKRTEGIYLIDSPCRKSDPIEGLKAYHRDVILPTTV